MLLPRSLKCLAAVAGVFSAATGFAFVSGLAACTTGSLLDESGGSAAVSTADAGSAAAQAEGLFRKLESDLSTSCGGAEGACHVQGVGGAPAWLKDPDRYVSIKGYDNSQSGSRKFILANTEESRLFTKGAHSGQELDRRSELGKQVEAWIKAEVAAAAAPKETTLISEAVSVSDGAEGSINLSKLGAGMKGAQLTFNVAIRGELLTLTNMQLVAPAANGIRATHPVFLQVLNGRATPDPGDSCANVDAKVGAGESKVLGPGTLVIPDFKEGAKVAFAFDAVQPYTVVEGGGPQNDGGGGPVGGCKNVPGFQGIASQFTTLSRNCVGCHGAGGNGQGALDFSELEKGDPDWSAACSAALSQVGLSNKPNSPLILAPAGNLTHAGGKLSAAEQGPYRDAILSWLAGE